MSGEGGGGDEQGANSDEASRAVHRGTPWSQLSR
jgi:hypothetical protein